MNRFLNTIKTYPIFLFIIIMCVVYLPPALVMEPESAKKTFVTAMAIDKADDELEVSLSIVVPIADVTSTEKIKILSARGDTINTCLSKLSLHVGKEIELTHTDLVIVNLDLGQENMAENLNFLITNFIISSGTQMIATSGSAKELLNASLNMFNSIGIKIYQLLNLNNRYVMAIDSTIESFYQGYLSKNQVSFLNIVDLKENEYEGIVADEGGTSSSGGGSLETSGNSEDSGGSGSKLQESSKKVVSNNGETAVFKEGKYITTLTPTETKALNWINTKARNDFIEIKNINDENLINGRMTLRNTFKKVSLNTKFENSKPVVEINLNLVLRIEEIYEGNGYINALGNDTKYFTKEVEKKIEETVKKSFIELIKKSRTYDADLLSIYGNFDLFNHKEFHIFLKTLEENESFYDKIMYKVNVNSIYKN